MSFSDRNIYQLPELLAKLEKSLPKFNKRRNGKGEDRDLCIFCWYGVKGRKSLSAAEVKKFFL